MWKKWITFALRGSIFAVKTDFEQKEGQLTHSIHRDLCGKPADRRKLLGLHKSSRTEVPTKIGGAFLRVSAARFFSGVLRTDCDAKIGEGRFRGSIDRVRAIKNPGRRARPAKGSASVRRCRERRRRPERFPGQRARQGSVKASSSTSVCVLFFISRSIARPVASSLSPRISV